ncbi:hypothetical protein K8R43_02195 [archaeon]|nr:hypothetical protein [archaeon]
MITPGFLLAIFSGIGALGFAVGIVYSLKNNKLTQYASSIWLIFCVSMGFACLWALTAALGQLSISITPGELQAVEYTFLACFASLLLATTYLSYAGEVKLT